MYGEVNELKKKIAVIIAAVLIAVCSFCVVSTAFDANDYDYSDWGGSDWGGSDWDSGGSIFFDFDDGGSSGGGGGGWSVPVIVVVVIVIIIISASKNKSKGGGGNNTAVGGGIRPANGGQGLRVILPDRTAQIEQIIKKSDPNFTSDDFTSFAKQVYIDIQTAWCKRDLTPVKPVLHTNLYNTTSKQVQSKIDQGVIYHYESIAINTAYLTSYVRDEQYEYLTVYLNARFIDYQTDEKTGNIIRGDKNTRWDFRYKMKFMRTVGVLTNSSSSEMDGHNCPNCGAPLDISSTGVCEYCNSVVTTGLYSWVLSDFVTVRDDTKDDGIRVPSDIAEASSGSQFNNNEGVRASSDAAGAKSSSGGLVDVVLLSYPEENKVKVISLVRQITGLGLAEAKRMVENLPAVITTIEEPEGMKMSQEEWSEKRAESIMLMDLRSIGGKLELRPRKQ